MNYVVDGEKWTPSGAVSPRLKAPGGATPGVGFSSKEAMSSKTTDDQNSIVDRLSFTSQTAKRASWEAFEFTIIGPNELEVTNASYGAKKYDHSYRVTVEEQDGLPVPVACTCPADEHYESDCKHKVAAATVGGRLLLGAVVAQTEPHPTNGIAGKSTDEATKADPGDSLITVTDCTCGGPNEFPCWPCVQAGRRTLDTE